MTFSWALEALKEGQLVRRSGWNSYGHIPHEYAYVELVNDVPGFDEMLVVTKNNGLKEPYRLNDQQVLAVDWELAD